MDNQEPKVKESKMWKLIYDGSHLMIWEYTNGSSVMVSSWKKISGEWAWETEIL